MNALTRKPVDLPSRAGSAHAQLYTAATGREVRLVVIDWAPVDLVHRALRDGILLLDRDRSARIRFEVDARNRYFDMQPILREYRKQRP